MSGNWFSESRNMELSLIYYLETEIEKNWTGVSITKNFTKSYEVDPPVVCINLLSDDVGRKEVGSDSLKHEYHLVINVFATSDGQRIDLSDFIVNTLKTGCVYYIHSHKSGSSGELNRVADGRMRIVDFINNSKIEIGSEKDLDIHDKYRHNIYIKAVKS